MDIEKILERIQYQGPRVVSLEVLGELMRAFLFSVPFENLDIHAHIKIILDPHRFYEKIVINHRGGFCYECNALFYELLRGLGFEVSIMAARMAIHETVSPGYSHMPLRVKLDQDYLVDVGNGQSVRDPMPIPGDVISRAEGIRYKVGRYNDNEFALYYRTENSDWAARFVFSTAPRGLDEFKVMCYYHQTSQESIFTKQRLCTLPTDNGRITLTDKNLLITEDGTETNKAVESKDELEGLLQKYFNINVQLSDLY